MIHTIEYKSSNSQLSNDEIGIGIVHPVWRPFELELPNFGKVITFHMACFCRVHIHGNGFDL